MLAAFMHLSSRNSPQFLLSLPSVPYTFVGRGEDVSTIKKFFYSPAIQVVHIVGPHGIGKATLAIQVSHELQNEGVDVVFIDISGHSTFKSISERSMMIIDGSINLNNSKESLTKWVRSRTSLTLVVFVKCDKWLETNNDNVEELKDLQNQSPLVKYILTSQYSLRAFQIQKYKQYEIGKLSGAASDELLRKLALNLIQEERYRIATLTDNHPLALQIVGAFFNLPEIQESD